MRTKLLVFAVMVSLVCPPVSHGFGVLQWAVDAVCNQLGLDRGPVPIKRPAVLAPGTCAPGAPAAKGRTQSDIYIQAGGY